MRKKFKLTEVLENVRKRGLIIKHMSLSGLFASEKNDSMVWFESNLEREFALSLEFHTLVESYLEQPVQVEYFDGERVKVYTPDFLIHFLESENIKPWLCEVKFKEDLKENLAKYKPKFKAAMELCKIEGWDFKLITEDYIRTPFLENAKFLHRYKFDYVDKGCYVQVMTAIQELRFTTPKDLMLYFKDAHFNVRGKCLYALWYAIKIGEINCDITLKLDMNSEIWPTTLNN